MDSLPAELTEEIITNLENGSNRLEYLKSLGACCLVSKSLYAGFRPYLFSRVELTDYQCLSRNSRIMRFLEVLEFRPEISTYVRSLDLQIIRSPPWDSGDIQSNPVVPIILRKLSIMKSFRLRQNGRILWSYFPWELQRALLDICTLPSIQSLEFSSIWLLPPSIFLGASGLRSLKLENVVVQHNPFYGDPATCASVEELHSTRSNITMPAFLRLWPCFFSQIRHLDIGADVQKNRLPTGSQLLVEKSHRSLINLSFKQTNISNLNEHLCGAALNLLNLSKTSAIRLLKIEIPGELTGFNKFVINALQIIKTLPPSSPLQHLILCVRVIDSTQRPPPRETISDLLQFHDPTLSRLDRDLSEAVLPHLRTIVLEFCIRCKEGDQAFKDVASMPIVPLFPRLLALQNVDFRVDYSVRDNEW